MNTNNIRAIRKSKKLTIPELSKRSGVSEPMIKVLESGEYDIMNSKLETLVKIAKALNTKVSKIVNEEERKYL